MQITVRYPSDPDTRIPLPVQQAHPWGAFITSDPLYGGSFSHSAEDPMVWAEGEGRPFLGIPLKSRAPERRLKQLHRAGLDVAQLAAGGKTAMLTGDLLPEGPWSLKKLRRQFEEVSERWASQGNVNPYLLAHLVLLPPAAEVIPVPSPAGSEFGAHRLVDELVRRGWLALAPGASAEALGKRLDLQTAEALEAVLMRDPAVEELYATTDALRGLLAVW